MQLVKVSVRCRITIHFEAVNNAFYAWLNGQLLGYSQDSCLPAEFDVTDIVSTDQNTLTVQVRAFHPSRRRSAVLTGQECSFATFFSVAINAALTLWSQVMRFSDGSYLEDMDHWWLSGIYR